VAGQLGLKVAIEQRREKVEVKGPANEEDVQGEHSDARSIATQIRVRDWLLYPSSWMYQCGWLAKGWARL
jgi:hypothetical protein